MPGPLPLTRRRGKSDELRTAAAIKGLTKETLAPILRSHGWSRLAPLEMTDDGFRYPLPLGSKAAVTVQIVATRKSVELHMEQPLPPRQRECVRDAVRHMLSLDFPLAEFSAMCEAKQATPLLRLARQGWGRMLRSPTYWEDAVKTLCTTNASWGYTRKMCRNLCAELGRATPSGAKTFPMPEDVLKAGERALTDPVGMGYRSKSLIALAERAAAGSVPWLLDVSRKPEAAIAEKEIRSWHGFGKYATRHLLVLMGFHDYLPIDREVGNQLGIRKPGDKGSDLDSTHFDEWGKFRFTAYKLTQVVSWMT